MSEHKAAKVASETFDVEVEAHQFDVDVDVLTVESEQ